MVSTKNRDLWPCPTPKVRDSRNSRHSGICEGPCINPGKWKGHDFFRKKFLKYTARPPIKNASSLSSVPLIQKDCYLLNYICLNLWCAFPENLCTEIGALRKRSTNRRNSTTLTLRFSVHRKHFEKKSITLQQ